MPVAALTESCQRTDAEGMGKCTRLRAYLSAEFRAGHLTHQRTVSSRYRQITVKRGSYALVFITIAQDGGEGYW